MPFRAPDIGDLEHRIALRKRTQTPAGGATGTDYTAAYTTVDEVWARVNVQFTGRVIDGVDDAERVTHVFTTRYRTDWQSNAWDVIEFDGRRFEVRGVERPGEQKHWLEILAEQHRTDV